MLVNIAHIYSNLACAPFSRKKSMALDGGWVDRWVDGWMGGWMVEPG